VGLQSGFVFAVIVAALLAAGHLGGPSEVAKRLFQLALAVALTFTVIAGTEAFIRNPSYEESESVFDSGGSLDDEDQLEVFEDFADRSSLRQMMQFAGGVIALILGLSFLRRLPVTAFAAVVGGVLMILFGGTIRSGDESTDPLSSFYAVFTDILGATIGQPSRLVDIGQFIMLAAGTLALGFIGLRTWDVESARAPGLAPPPDEPAAV
jgi:hypothetical protein